MRRRGHSFWLTFVLATGLLAAPGAGGSRLFAQAPPAEPPPVDLGTLIDRALSQQPRETVPAELPNLQRVPSPPAASPPAASSPVLGFESEAAPPPARIAPMKVKTPSVASPTITQGTPKPDLPTSPLTPAVAVEPTSDPALVQTAEAREPDMPTPLRDGLTQVQFTEPAGGAEMLPQPGPLAVATGGCAGCGRFNGLGPRWSSGAYDHGGGDGGCESCGGGWACAPGHRPCHPCEADTKCGRFLCDFYRCVCCPDPCYDPQWTPLPNAAFFVDGARPVTQQEIRWNGNMQGRFPDRSEYIWARADGQGKGPRPPTGVKGETGFTYNDLVLNTEIAIGKLAMITTFPYRSFDPDTYPHAAGFGDMSIATNTLLFDCELLQVSFEFRTYMPMGNALKGTGTGHLSLEPSVIFAVKCSHDTYVQAQFAEWIPLGGDPSYAGSIWHMHGSLNHVLCRILPDVPLIGTLELQTWSFQDGQFTDPVLGAFQKSSDTTYVMAGPGLRLFVCDKLDIGFAASFALTSEYFAREYYSVSFRARF
jgi:hypothetical protein